MKKNILTLLFVGLASISSLAYAWGDREQGILQGMAGLLLFQQLSRPQDPVLTPPPYVYVPPPVYVSPPPVYYHRPTCFFVPQQDSWGRVMYYRQVCR